MLIDNETMAPMPMAGTMLRPRKRTIHTHSPVCALQLLSEEEHAAYIRYLNQRDDCPFDLGASVIAGSIGIRSDLLKQAVRIADTFRKVCASIHRNLHADQALLDALLRPFHSLPVLKNAALEESFFMNYFRMDFFLDHESESLKIMEVNSGGAGLSDYLQCIEFLKDHHSFSLPGSPEMLTVPYLLSSMLNSARMKGARTIGFVAVENGNNEYMWEYLTYARWMREHADIRPVLLSLTDGVLSLFEHPEVPLSIASLDDLDTIYTDWFEDLACLERAQRQIDAHGIRTIPSRTDHLFENKHFLSVLLSMEKPVSISENDWNLLQSALIPSFPLEDFESRIEEMRAWNGIVLKMDLDCASENVFIYDFESTTLSVALSALKHTLLYGHPSSEPSNIPTFKPSNIQTSASPLPTWTIQAYTPPPLLPLVTPATTWITPNYSAYKYDLMTYMCYENNIPRVLFGSRCFSRDKWDEMTDDGRKDGLWGPVSIL